MSSHRRSSTRITTKFGGRSLRPQAAASTTQSAKLRNRETKDQRPKTKEHPQDLPVTSHESRFPSLYAVHELHVPNLATELDERITIRTPPSQVLEFLRQRCILTQRRQRLVERNLNPMFSQA